MTKQLPLLPVILSLLVAHSPRGVADDDLLLDLVPILVGRIAPASGPTGSYANQSSPLHIDRRGVRSAQFDGTFVSALVYVDLDGDTHDDVIMSSGDGSEDPTPIEMYLNRGDGTFVLDYGAIDGAPPGLVHPRKALLCRLNADSVPDVVLIGHGFDQPPFPGESLVLLLSSSKGYVASTLDNVTGFLHGGSCADIDGDGDNDVFVTDTQTPYMLVNDGEGNLSHDSARLPSDLGASPFYTALYTAELIDVDSDGYFDLLVGGHEHEGMATAIYWGGNDGRYVASRRTVLPLPEGGNRWTVVLDFDAEDVDGDGARDVLVTRTGGPPNFYQGYSLQLLMQRDKRQFVDETDARVASPRDEDAPWIDWMRVEDIDADGDVDLFPDDAAHGLVWSNDGGGTFELE